MSPPQEEEPGPGRPVSPRPGRPAWGAGTGARMEAVFERMLELSRIVIVAPVIVLVLSGIGAFAYGTDIFVASVPSILAEPLPVGNKVGLFLIEIDLYLVGATLIIAAFGFYELFISKIGPGEGERALPRWLEMHDLNDLKARVISMLILVAAVSFVDVVLDFHDVVGVLYLGGAVALVIAALTAFLRFGSGERGGGHP